MNGTVVARVRRVMFGHSERALVHAVDEDGREYKIEVPSDTMKGVAAGGDYTLTLTWTVAPAAVAQAPVAGTAQPSQGPTPLPSTVDEKFMRLMGRPGGRDQAAMASTTMSQNKSSEPSTAAQQLAQRLGIPSSRTAG